MSEKPQLYLLIAGKYYRVERIAFAEKRPDLRGWTLTAFEDELKHGPYQVIRDGNVATCQCADFVMQKHPIGKHCKHIEALKTIGLLS